MPTKMPRVTFAISQEELLRVEAFQKEHNIKNQSQAVIQLIRMGFNDVDMPPEPLSPADDLEQLVHQLTPAQAAFMVRVVEKVLKLNPDAYAAACKESANLWKG